MIKGVLFDLDGTLIDSSPDFVNCLNTILTDNNQTNISEADMRHLVSDGSNLLLKTFLHIKSDNELQQIREQFFILYKKELLNGSKLFEGVAELIGFLESEQIPWGIVTNKFRRFAEIIVSNNLFLKKSQVLITPDDIKIAKPDPEGILKATQLLGISSQECIYVGDHLKDLEAATNAGMESIGCLFGYSMKIEKDTKKHTQYFVKDAFELKTLLSKKIAVHEK
jgi:2-phosphoglycolate phosphatase